MPCGTAEDGEGGTVANGSRGGAAATESGRGVRFPTGNFVSGVDGGATGAGTSEAIADAAGGAVVPGPPAMWWCAHLASKVGVEALGRWP